MDEAKKKRFLDSVKGKVHFDRLLKDGTYFKMGGPAQVWIEPLDLQDLERAVHICRKSRLPIFVLGGGSNLLASDRPIRKAVIELSSPFFRRIEFCNNRVICGSGVGLTDLIRACIRSGLGGLEFLAGIPGTVGGAVAMNAGSPSGSIAEFVYTIKVMDYQAREKEFGKSKLKFGYRSSNLSGKIILGSSFKLRKSNPRLLRKRFDGFLRRKKLTQPVSYPNAGCVFKNPPYSKRTAGELLESAGLKGKRIGDAQFSKRHANFIVNRGKAGFRDVRRLMKLAQEEVKKRHKLWLEPEVKIVI